LGSPTFTLPECAYPERESGWFPRPFASCRWNLGNDLPAPGVVYVRGFARQPPIPRQGALVTSRMEVRSALGPAITRAGGIKSNEGRGGRRARCRHGPRYRMRSKVGIPLPSSPSRKPSVHANGAEKLAGGPKDHNCQLSSRIMLRRGLTRSRFEELAAARPVSGPV
jgi:hypothetical protein